ncbi:type II toxin-antitoxin system HicA family toxin [Ferrigenium sp. UT5]|uniref:type II toxin-antitoxin system HicA family toxin n=1 Tax=Ferrigenium sp. UT5 TaxID=3242105 RepID=UPI00355456B1
MKLPRNLNGAQLIKSLDQLGYRPTRQSGSHVRVTCSLPKEHHITIPLHDPLRIGTLAAILAEVASHHGLSRDRLIGKLFGK